jgi:signal transduction histidine kinase
VGVVATLGSPSKYDWLEGVVRASMVGAPVAVGLYARSRPPFARFGSLLVVAGAFTSVAVLASSSAPLLYSVGRIGGWVAEVVLIYTILAFPTGRLPARKDRLIVGATAVMVATLYLPTALLVTDFPAPSPWSLCSTDCPANAFALVSQEPAFVAGIVQPLREVITVALFMAAIIRLASRLAAATSVMRRTLAPALLAAIGRLVVFTAAIVGRQAAGHSGFAAVSAWLVALSTPVFALAFLAGVTRWRFFVAQAMQDLATRLPGHPRPEEVRRALAEAFRDPAMTLVYWRIENGEARWVDAACKPFTPPALNSERWLTVVADGDERLGGIVHDAALRDDDAFVATATAYVLMTLDNQRLTAQTAALLSEVRDSQARIQATADDERRRIERDLHDGAQQRLVALRIKLELAAEQSSDADRPRADMLRELGTEVEEAIDEVRSLAQGIYPSALADRGLVEALRSAALQSPLHASVLAADVGRYSREIESTAYFCCLEALQNAAKHAHGASAVVVELSDAGRLRIEVRDDGAGFDLARALPGAGFLNMRDRVSAMGGDLAFVTSPGKGTRIIATIPLDHRPATRARDERADRGPASLAGPLGETAG